MRARSLVGLAIMTVVLVGAIRATEKLHLRSGNDANRITIKDTPAVTVDWPQWRGPDRSDRSNEKGLLKTWPKDGPKLAWTFTDAGNGYGGPAIVGDRVYLLGMEKGVETLFALDAGTGKALWTSPLAKPWDFDGNAWSLGPNSTPTVDGDLIFALGSQGLLVCVDTKGKEVWRKDLVKELGGQVTSVGGGPATYGWGFNWSPLVDGDQLIVTPGGKKGLFASLDKKTGKLLWQSKAITEDCTYGSPIVADIGGVRQYIANTQSGPVAVDTKGQFLWKAKPKRTYSTEMVIPTPLVSGDYVFVTAAKSGADLFKITKAGATLTPAAVWASKELANFHGGVVLVDNHVYGSHAEREWKCFDFLKGGMPAWESPNGSLGFGSLTYADGHLFLYAQDTGEVGMIEASPKGYKEEGRFSLPKKSTIRKPSGKFWTHPVVANGHLFIRDQEFLFCYTIK